MKPTPVEDLVPQHVIVMKGRFGMQVDMALDEVMREQLCEVKGVDVR